MLGKEDIDLNEILKNKEKIAKSEENKVSEAEIKDEKMDSEVEENVKESNKDNSNEGDNQK